MDRSASWTQLVSRQAPWDMAIIGGGATGVGIAVDAASRGYSVCLLEQADFGSGTSSRSTKLIHGGVRYLQQGNIALVMEALKERGILRQNAPHLVHDLAFIVPNYAWWETPFYGIGMRVYDLLAGRYGFGRSRILSTDEVLDHIPTLDPDGLRGGVLYYDGQFDDARLVIDLAQTAQDHGAVLLNYVRVTGLAHDRDGYIDGLRCRNLELGAEHAIWASCVINATGPFCDAIRKEDEPGASPMVAPSQGVHLVVNESFLPGKTAIMVPRTSDGRVMFAIPWHGHVLLGTTDTAVEQPTLDPVATDQEIDFILQTAGEYLAQRPTRRDVLSVFAGIRPLVRSGGCTGTAELSREHAIQVSRSGLLSIVGGKWTTYRRMAEECVNHAATLARLPERPCVTRSLRIHGYHTDAEQFGALGVYGSAAESINELARSSPQLSRRLHEALPICAAQVVWAVRQEMARTVEDVLVRRTCALVLNARAAIEMAPAVAELMAAEMQRDPKWQLQQLASFRAAADKYLIQ